jgi:hypothetical protein
MLECPECRGLGWVCGEHAGQVLHHNDSAKHDSRCRGVGMPCAAPDCPFADTLIDAAEFLSFSRWKLIDHYWPRFRKTALSLTPEQFWWRPLEAHTEEETIVVAGRTSTDPAAVTNAAGNLVLHLVGNMSQWLVWPFTGHTQKRQRWLEFNFRCPPGRETPEMERVLHEFDRCVAAGTSVLMRVSARELKDHYPIQGLSNVSGVEAIYQTVEHFGLHYGELLYLTKMLQQRDLGFYAFLNKTGLH